MNKKAKKRNIILNPYTPWMRCNTFFMAFLMFFYAIIPPSVIAYETQKSINEMQKESSARKHRTQISGKLPAGLQNEAAGVKLRNMCKQLLTNLDRKKDYSQQIKDIEVMGQTFDKIKLKTITMMTAMRDKLTAKKIDPRVLKRLETRRQEIVGRFNEFSRLINQVLKHKNNQVQLKTAINELILFLDQADKKTDSKKAVKATTLPRRTEVNRDKIVPGASYFFSGRRLVAGASDVISDLLQNLEGEATSGDPADADKAATTEIILDAKIVALAAELGNDPVKIFEYVRNNFAYEPYFGSVKGAKRTLIEKAGNDMDQASLLMALLRASNVPCRYVFGTIEMPTADAGKWVGVDEPNQIAKVFTANDIPVQLINSGGTVGTIRLDHVWVKAYVDYFPYRGAVNEQSDTWIEIDPSFKQNTFTDNHELEYTVGIDPGTLLTNIKAQSTVETDPSAAINVPEPYILSEIYSYATPIRSYLAANSLTTENVFRQRKVNEEKYGIIPVSDQYKIVARGLSFHSLPDKLRYKLTFSLFNPDNTAAFAYTVPTAALDNQQITLSYKPATETDAQQLADNASETNFPVFLVSLTPELSIGGQVVGSGSSITMGHKQKLQVKFVPPTGNEDIVEDAVTAGSVNALVLDCQTTVPAMLERHKARLDAAALALQNDPSALTRDDTIGAALHGVGLSYFHQIDRFNQITAGSLKVAITRRPSMVRVVWDLNVAEQFGLPYTATVDRVKIDVDRDVNVPVAIAADDRAAENQFAFTSALTSTALEHNVLSQPFMASAASAARVLQNVNLLGGRIYTVTKDNVDAVCALLPFPAAAITDIRNAVNAGMEVTVPDRTGVVGTVEYYAYIKRDIDTSASEFVMDAIAGGELVNNSLKAGDLLTFGDATRYANIVKPVADWLKVAEESTTNAGLAYLPAITSINSWYADRTALDPVTTMAAVIAVSGPITDIYNKPAILNVTTSDALISPNGDGVKDSFQVTADVTRGAAWNFVVTDKDNTEVYSASGTSAALDVTSGANLADGSYSYKITASASGLNADSVTGSFKVDSAAPTAAFSSIADGQELTGTVILKGTADDANFNNYTVVVTGADPVSSNNIVVDGSLHILDTTALTNGFVDLTLTVTDKAGNKTIVTRNVTVNNPIPDITKPTLALSVYNPDCGRNVQANETVISDSGVLNVTLNADDDTAVKNIKLYIDGSLLAQNSNDAILTHNLDTFSLTDGSHTLTAQALDAAGNVSDTASLTFTLSGAISNFKVTPQVATVGNSTVTVSANLRASGNWTLSFNGPAAISTVAGSGSVVSYSFDASQYADGAYTVKLAVDNVTTQPERAFNIDLVLNKPVAAIANIEESQVIRDGLFELVGTADDVDVNDAVSYKVLVRDQDTFAVVADVTPQPVDASGYHVGRVANASLGTLDFTMLKNNSYTLQLEVKGGADTVTAEVDFALNSQLKVGQLGFSQQDLIIPVGGMPLSVIRTYNSLNVAEPGDFGYGWTWALKDVDMKIGGSRDSYVPVGESQSVSIRTGGARNVDITLPDGTRTTFTYSVEPSRMFEYQAVWTASPGVKATLKPLDSAKLFALPGLFPYWEAAGPYTPMDNFEFSGFTLTTKDGTEYKIERENLGEHEILTDEGESIYVTVYGKGSLKRITQRSGDTIDFSDDKIEHFNPQGVKTRSIVFTRNAEGLINAIHDPENLDANGDPIGYAKFTYEYDFNKNLIKVNKLKDRATGEYLTTEFLYETAGRPHYISSIKDARGKTPMLCEYDGSGRLVATIDADGNRIEMQHDLTGKSETVFDRAGNPTVHTYDTRGNVTSTTNAHGYITRRTYDENNNELTVTNPLGYTTAYTYDSNNNRTSVTDPLGNKSTFTYDAYGNQLTSTDPLGHKTTNTYDGSGNLLTSTNALGQTTTNVYTDGNLTTTYDANGDLVSSFGYDGSGNMTSSTDRNNVTRNFSYDPNGKQTGSTFTWTDPTGTLGTKNLTTQTIYNAADQVVKTIDSEGNASTTVYNEIEKPIQRTDKLGNTTNTVYDARGNVTETQYADGTVSRTVYDIMGRGYLTQDRHVPGATANGSRSIYDAVGRVIRTERLSDVKVTVTNGESALESVGSVISSTSNTYDAAGRVLVSTDVEGNQTKYEYDAAGRSLATTDALGNRTTYEYDVAGRQTKVTDALGRETKFEYDALGRRVKTIFADNTFTSVVYNTLGQKIRETDQSGISTEFEYDAMGRLAKVIKPQVDDGNGNMVNPEWSYSYNIYGNLARITDPKGRENTFTYDQYGRQLTRTLPMGQSESQEFNTLGQTVKKTDFKGQVTEFIYDWLGRVETKNLYAAGSSSAGETVQVVYDDLGRQKEITEARGTTTFTYDINGRVTQIVKPEGTINYVYDQVTGRKTKTWSAKSEQAYEYDELGRLKKVIVLKRNGVDLNTPNEFVYNYNNVGLRNSITLPNGITTKYEYNGLNRLTKLTHKNSAGDVLADYSYTLAPNGRRTAIAEQRLEPDGSYSNTNINYTYDKLYRLTKEVSTSTENSPNFSNQYIYDANGNRVQKLCTAGGATEAINYTYNNNDQLTIENSSAKGITNYQYDANGSLISKSSNDESNTFTYNLHNRLASATIQRTEEGQLVNITGNYTYDQSGIRVKSMLSVNGNSQNRIFLVDNMNHTGYAQIFEEAPNVGDPLTRSYVIGDDILSQETSEGVKHLLYDGHGSTRVLTNVSGVVTDRYSYDAFGIMLGGNPTTTTPAATDLLYSGEQFDVGLQSQYLRARYYNQNIGRFYSIDPFAGYHSDPQSLHKYAYCHSDPVNGTDPTGKFFTVNDKLSTMAIRMILENMVDMAISPIMDVAAAKTLPQAYRVGLLTAMHASAINIGSSLAASIGQYVAFGDVAGIDLLISPTNLNMAFYTFLGGYFEFRTAKGIRASISSWVGVIFDCPRSDDYQGPFYTIHIPIFKYLSSVMKLKIMDHVVRAINMTNILGGALRICDKIFTMILPVISRLSISVFIGESFSGPKGFSFSYNIGKKAGNADWALSITTFTQQAPSRSVPFDVGLVNDREHKPPKESIYGRLTREFFEYLVELYYK